MWIMNERYNKQWDIRFNDLIRNFEFTNITNFDADLGDTNVWIANYPYASFNKKVRLNDDIIEKVRPSRYTIYMAGKKLNKAMSKLKESAFKTI